MCYLALLYVPPLVASPAVWLFAKWAPWRVGEAAARLWWGWVRAAVELGGPAFIKLAQWAAMRTDLFPGRFCRELAVLHADTTPHPLWVTEATLDAEHTHTHKKKKQAPVQVIARF